MKEVNIYVDGAARPNPGITGAGIVFCYGKVQKEISVELGYGTNITAEIYAVIRALQWLKEPCKVTIYSDSEYVVNTGNGKWQRISHHDIWNEYDKAVDKHNVTLVWLRKDSHNLNSKAHNLANLITRPMKGKTP